jgi:hypothetical protein
MAVLAYSDIVSAIEDLVQSSASTDNPLTVDSTLLPRFINRAYRTVWELEGGAYKKASSKTAWAGAQLCTGTAIGLLPDIDEALHVYATTTGDISVGATTGNTTTLLTSSTAFVTNNITAGMDIAGTNVGTGARVLYVTDASNLTMSVVSGGSGGSSTKTFTPTDGPYELNRSDLSLIQALRSTSGYGSYSIPKVYSITRLDTTTPSAVGLVQLDWWPSVTGYYFPIHYVPILTPLDSATVTTPNVTDIGSEDIAYLAAAELAPLLGRAELVPSITLRLSERTRLALERRESALLAAKSDK